ncbi:MAG: hypothetical protein QM790_16820 [Nibricoccus sp.]
MPLEIVQKVNNQEIPHKQLVAGQFRPDLGRAGSGARQDEEPGKEYLKIGTAPAKADFVPFDLPTTGNGTHKKCFP